jgi:hypothetical protein
MMRNPLLLLFLCSTTTIFAVENAAPIAKPVEEAAAVHPKMQAIMSIDPQVRALDLKDAFDRLRQEKTSNKVFFDLSDGTRISNVIEMSVIGKGTLVLFKVSSMQGIKLQVVPVEKIVTISHL